jgi:hypothetical protein
MREHQAKGLGAAWQHWQTLDVRSIRAGGSSTTALKEGRRIVNSSDLPQFGKPSVDRLARGALCVREALIAAVRCRVLRRWRGLGQRRASAFAIVPGVAYADETAAASCLSA